MPSGGLCGRMPMSLLWTTRAVHRESTDARLLSPLRRLKSVSFRWIQIVPAMVRSAASRHFSDHSLERPHHIVKNDHVLDYAVEKGLLRGTNCCGVAVFMNAKPMFVDLAFFESDGPAAHPASDWKVCRNRIGFHTSSKRPPLHRRQAKKGRITSSVR
jgi:hypothetical protein